MKRAASMIRIMLRLLMILVLASLTLAAPDKRLVKRAVEYENVALQGVASQSSTYSQYPSSKVAAENAIDGNDDGVLEHNSCTHTGVAYNGWWKVDLGTTYDISQVVITNRLDCCQERIDGAVVLIGDTSDISDTTQCGDEVDWSANTYGDKITFDCELSGSVVFVQIKDHRWDLFSLCEVEVNVMMTVNLALQGFAAQSSTYSQYPSTKVSAWNAIDGNDDGVLEHNSCTHTEVGYNGWWKVDLGTRYDISKVVVTNRQDCCQERIDGAVVLIGNDFYDISATTQCGDQVDMSANTYGDKITFDCAINGRVVVVQIKERRWDLFSLCEVEVYGV